MRLARWGLVAVLGLVVLLVLADRVAVRVAQSRMESQITASQGAAAAPEVSISGFPFLTQVLTGHYAGLDVRLKRVDVVETGLRVRNVSIRLSDVRAPLSCLRSGQQQSCVSAGSATVVGSAGYADILSMARKYGIPLLSGSPLPIPDLPSGLVISKINTSLSGVTFTLTGQNLSGADLQE